jgi:hypothetical protein
VDDSAVLVSLCGGFRVQVSPEASLEPLRALRAALPTSHLLVAVCPPGTQPARIAEIDKIGRVQVEVLCAGVSYVCFSPPF